MPWVSKRPFPKNNKRKVSIIQEKKRKVEGYICHSHLSEDAGEDFHFDSVGVDETHVDVAGFTAQEVGGRTKQTKHRIRIMHLNLKESVRERMERGERKRGEKKGNKKEKVPISRAHQRRIGGRRDRRGMAGEMYTLSRWKWSVMEWFCLVGGIK